MTTFTGTQIKTKIQYDCDIFEDNFVDLDVELLGYINDAVDDCEALIHGLYSDYFLVRSTISLVSSTSTYSLPSDIYANKIRALLYDDGTAKYEIKRVKKIADTMHFQTGDRYQYLLTNDSSNGVKARFYPTPNETNSNVIIWYIRNAKRLSAYSDTCDIPEFINYIYAHIKRSLARKERIGLDLEVASRMLDQQEKLLNDTLSEMVLDEGNDIRPDFSFYADFDQDIYQY